MSKKEIYETELPHRAVAVYLYLKDRANKEGTCYPAIGTIARELHLSVSTVKRAMHVIFGEYMGKGMIIVGETEE